MHVYLVHATGTNRYKIGITARTIEYRMRELNGSQSAYPLELITSIRSSDYKEVERHLHEKYAINRVHNEWFSFSPEQLAEVKNYMQTFDTPLHGIKPILKPKTQLAIPSFQLPGKEWVIPLLLGLGIVMMCRQCEFLQPSSISPHHSETMQLRK